MSKEYDLARQAYLKYGVDTELAIKQLEESTISVHCWQGDDVVGFDSKMAASGGIQTTGNYPGKATTVEQLMADFDQVLKLTAGKKRLNLHASYAIDNDDRSNVSGKHFDLWIKYAKERGLGIDFNPTFFSHPMVKDGLTLSSPNKEVRDYWIRHGQNCLRVAEYIASELNNPCYINFWMPDGFKDYPADRYTPRERMKQSLDEIFSINYDKNLVIPTLESKVFGIGVEAYTVVSSEFCLSYALTRNIMPLCDNGHYHPTETVSDKISSILNFSDKMMLHVTRPMRWDSDHVVSYDDETREMMKEVVRCGINKVVIATDYFDASINRIAAWVNGIRDTQKALLYALLEPKELLKKLQDENDFTSLQYYHEDIKLLPIGAVYNEFLERNNVPISYIDQIKEYEREVLLKR